MGCCPLPVTYQSGDALLSGTINSTAAKLNVIIKDGGALEVLARVRSAAFEKTATLTQGRPDVVEIRPITRSTDEILRLAAAAEQYSVHVFAGPIVAHALAAGPRRFKSELSDTLSPTHLSPRKGMGIRQHIYRCVSYLNFSVTLTRRLDPGYVP